MSRISLNDSLQSAFIQLAEGNPGAANVLVALIKSYPHIDPQSAFKELTPLLWLDDRGVYGSRIWMLFKDVCDQKLIRMVTLMRGVQLGFVSEQEVLNAIDGRYTRTRLNVNFDDLYKMVKEYLDGKFDSANEYEKEVSVL